jgi:hypothetical protein
MIAHWLKTFASPVSTPVVLTANDTLAGDWLQMPNGGTVSFKDGTGQVQNFTLIPQEVLRCAGAFHSVESSSDVVRVGTGEGPVAAGPQGPAGSASQVFTDGVQTGVAADGAANTAIAETFLGSVFSDGTVEPWFQVRAAVTADASNYASLIFKLYRAGSVVQTWTQTTQLVGGGGTGNLTSGQIWELASIACQRGDWVTYTQTKTGTGVQLPAHSFGMNVAG